MRQFRVSKSLKKRGLSKNEQALIYYTLINRRHAQREIDYIDALCKDIVGDGNGVGTDGNIKPRWHGLKKFLTDDTVNDAYITMNYGMRSEDLYKYRNEFYERWYRDKK